MFRSRLYNFCAEPVYIIPGRKSRQYITRLCIYLLWFILFSCFSILNPLLVSGSQALSPFEIDKLTGQKAPDFVLKDINGERIRLSSLNGNVVVLNFWAIWCPTCKRDLASLNRLSSLYGERDIAVISIALGNPSAVKDFIRNNHFVHTMLIDYDLIVSSSIYKIFIVPTTFIIDRNGIIVKRYFGQQNWTDEKIIKELKVLLDDKRIHQTKKVSLE